MQEMGMREMQGLPELLTDTNHCFFTRTFLRVPVPLALILAAGVTSVGCNSRHKADVVATVNGHAIMRSELDKGYQAQLGEAPQQRQLPQEQADSLRLNVLRELIDEEIIEQRATKMNLTATNEEVDAKFAEMKARYPEDQFQERLKASNQTVDDLKRALRRNLTINKLLNKEINSKITVTDADVANYYNQHKAEFNLIEPQYHLAQILVTTQPNPQVRNMKAQNEADARKKIQMIENRLDSGEDFATVAMNYSEQPETAQNGGDLGFIPESSLKSDKLAFDAINKLRPGQFTAILPVSDPNGKQIFGFRIVRLLSREVAGQRELKDPRVQQAIREQLRDRREQLLKAAYYETIRDQAKIDNYFAEDILKQAGTAK
jgi:peptidyl-prolyl cis-trans isomerase SurA